MAHIWTQLIWLFLSFFDGVCPAFYHMSCHVRKCTFGHERPGKILIRLCEWTIWSESSLGAFLIVKDAKLLHASNEDWFEASLDVRVRRYVFSLYGSYIFSTYKACTYRSYTYRGCTCRSWGSDRYVKINRKCHNYTKQPSQVTKRRNNEDQIKTKQRPHIKPQTHKLQQKNRLGKFSRKTTGEVGVDSLRKHAFSNILKI